MSKPEAPQRPVPQAVVMLAGYFLNSRIQAQETKAMQKGIHPENLWDQFPQVRADWTRWAVALAWGVYEESHKMQG